MSSTMTITRLRALIEHPRTGAEERATAERMLDRRLATSSGTIGGGTTSGRNGVGRHARIEHVVDAIRTEIALARTLSPVVGSAECGPEPVIRDLIRDAPDCVTVDVAADGAFAIAVTIDGVPADWGWVNDAGLETVSPELQALADRIAEVVGAYNDCGPDGAPRFFARVRVPGCTLVW